MLIMWIGFFNLLRNLFCREVPLPQDDEELAELCAGLKIQCSVLLQNVLQDYQRYLADRDAGNITSSLKMSRRLVDLQWQEMYRRGGFSNDSFSYDFPHGSVSCGWGGTVNAVVYCGDVRYVRVGNASILVTPDALITTLQEVSYEVGRPIPQAIQMIHWIVD